MSIVILVGLGIVIVVCICIGRVDTAEHYQILMKSTDEAIDRIRAETAAFDACDTLFEAEVDHCEASTDPRRQKLAQMILEEREKLADLEAKAFARHPKESFDYLAQEVSHVKQSLMSVATVSSLREQLTSQEATMDQYNSWSQSLVAAMAEFQVNNKEGTHFFQTNFNFMRNANGK